MDARPDETEFLERLRARDEAAFNQLVGRYQTQVFRIAFRMLGNREEAEDLTQEVFVTVFKAIDSFRGDSKFSTWLYRVATNQAKNRLKYLVRRARGATLPFDEQLDDRGPLGAPLGEVHRPDELTSARQTQEMVQRALVRLDADQRELIVLRDLELLSYEEIQEVTGLALGTVKSRLHRARVALFKVVSELTGEETKP